MQKRKYKNRINIAYTEYKLYIKWNLEFLNKVFGYKMHLTENSLL